MKTANTLLLCRKFRSCVGGSAGSSGHVLVEVPEFLAGGYCSCILPSDTQRFWKYWVLEDRNSICYPFRAFFEQKLGIGHCFSELIPAASRIVRKCTLNPAERDEHESGRKWWTWIRPKVVNRPKRKSTSLHACILFNTIFDTSANRKGLQIGKPYVKIGTAGNDKKITIIAKPKIHKGLTTI